MIESSPVSSLSSEPDEQLAAVVNEVSRKIQAGQLVDLEGYVRQHPDWAERLRRLFPAMQSLAELGLSVSSDSRADVRIPLPSHPPTSVLGDYRILREIGRGGMGVVYEAEQLSLHRRVALKMLPLAGILDHRQLQRFKTEAQAAAMLHQDNIVPVYGVGCERGVHYYAMQYIEGQTLAQLIRDLRRQEGLDAPVAAATGLADPGDAEATPSAAPRGAGGLSPGRESSSAADPTTGYSPQPPGAAASAETQPVAGAAIATQRSTDHAAYFRDVAELGAHVADALEHAHEEGVIHRDIKPSNLILDQRGKVWVTDFGLARIASDPGISMTGDIVGTLRYMSPEQALAKRVLVDHRTDIYSLCATLYELLTLEPVFRGHDRQEVIKRIAFDEPRGLRKLNKAIPAELETVVLKGLEKNPDHRYATAKEVAQDLRRFLEDKPIRARPPTLGQRAAKWSRRNKPLVASAAVILLLGVLALAVSTVLIARERNAAAAAAETARRERDEAQKQRGKAEEQRRVAEENFRRARQAVDTYLTKVSQEQLLNEPGMQKLRESLLRLALEYYQGFIQQRSDDPEVLAELATAHDRVGDITSSIGTSRDARRPYEEGLKLRKQLVGRHPDNPRYRDDLATSYLRLGRLDQSTGQLEHASTSVQEAIKILRALVSEHPKEPEYQNDLAAAYGCLGDLQCREKRYEDALQSLEEAVAIGEGLKRLQEKHPDANKHLNALATNYDRKAHVLYMIRKYPEALATREDVQGINELLVKEDPSSLEYQSDLAALYNNVAVVRASLGDVDRALELYTKAVEVKEKLAAQNPLVLSYQEGLAIITVNMACLQQAKDAGKALATYGIAIEKMRDLARKDPSKVSYREHLGGWLRNRAWLQAEKFQADDEAFADQTESVKILTQLVVNQPSLSSAKEDLAGAYLQRSKFYEKVGKYDDAIADCTAAIENRVSAVEEHLEPWLARKRVGSAHMYRANTYGRLAKHDESMQDYDEAMRWLRQSVELATDGVDRDERIDALNLYFAVCEAAGKHAEAKKVWTETREDVAVKVADEQLPAQYSADYVLRIEEPGEYQLYLRWGGEDRRGGRVLAGLFNDQDQVVDWYLFQGGAQYPDAGDGDADFATHSWETFGERRHSYVGDPLQRPKTRVLEQPALFSVPGPGMYFLRLMMNYVPVAADAMVFQQSHLPAPENEGPPESPRDADGAFVASGGRVTVEAEHFSFAIASWVVVPNEKEPEARHKHFRGSGYLLAKEWGKDAEELVVARSQQAFEVKRRVRGETHPSTLVSMAELACHLIWNQKRYNEAEKLHQQLLERWKDMNAQDSALEDKLNMLSLNVYWRCDWRGAEVFGRQGVERARRFDPDGVELMFNAAPFLLLSGQHDEFRMICRELLENHAQTESAATAARVVRMCVLDPDFGESRRLVSLGQRAAKGDKDWNLYALGMAYCRVGDYDKSLQWLQKAFDSQGRTPGGQAIVARLLAITYQRAGRTEEAKSWLNKMEKLMEPLAKVSIPARNETYVYGREAKSLIQASAAKPSPADAKPRASLTK